MRHMWREQHTEFNIHLFEFDTANDITLEVTADTPGLTQSDKRVS